MFQASWRAGPSGIPPHARMHTYYDTTSDVYMHSQWVRFLPIAMFITFTSPPDDAFSFGEPFLVRQGFSDCSTLPHTHFFREGDLYLMYSNIIVFIPGSNLYQVHYVYGAHYIIFCLCYASMSCTIQYVLHWSVLYFWANHYFCTKLSQPVRVCLPHLIEICYHNIKGYLY